MKIKEAQEQTGISMKNIRFYEKQGLLTAGRNEDNHYRIYNDHDIQRLKQIKLLRKMGLSIRHMKMLFDGDLDLSCCLELRREEIKEEQNRLADMFRMCEQLIHDGERLDRLDPDYYLREIQIQEQNGGRFINVAWDYMTRAVNIFPTPELWFEPEEPILTRKDFTKELLIWGEKNKRRIEFFHEGMEPVILLDGKRYLCMLEQPRILELKGALRVLPFFADGTYGFKFAYLYPYQ